MLSSRQKRHPWSPLRSSLTLEDAESGPTAVIVHVRKLCGKIENVISNSHLQRRCIHLGGAFTKLMKTIRQELWLLRKSSFGASTGMGLRTDQKAN